MHLLLALRMALLVSAAIFATSSYWHIARNAFFEPGQIEDEKKLRLQKLSVAIFALCALTYTAINLRSIFSEILLVGICCTLIHGFRAGLDFSDGSDSRTLHVAVRHGLDATANFVTLSFVIAVASQQDRLLAWPALLLSLGLIGKELIYRWWLDLGPRTRNQRKTSQGGPGAPSPMSFQTRHAASNTVKSLVYFIAGYAACYLSLATLNKHYSKIIIGDGVGNQFFRALSFSARNMQIAFSGDSDWLLIFLSLLEFVGTLFLLWTFNTIPNQRS